MFKMTLLVLSVLIQFSNGSVVISVCAITNIRFIFHGVQIGMIHKSKGE